jgi:hypothetical protein
VGAGVPDAGAVPAGEGDVEPDALPVPLAEPVYDTYVLDAVGDARELPVPDAERKVAEGDREREDVAEGDEVPSVADGVGEPVPEGEGEAVAGVPDADVDGVADAEPEGVGKPVRDAEAPAETVAAAETVAKGDGEDDDVAVDVKAVADGEPEAPAVKVAVSETNGVVGSAEGDPLDEPDWVKKDVVGAAEGVPLGVALAGGGVGEPDAEPVPAVDDALGDALTVFDDDDETKAAEGTAVGETEGDAEPVDAVLVAAAEGEPLPVDEVETAGVVEGEPLSEAAGEADGEGEPEAAVFVGPADGEPDAETVAAPPPVAAGEPEPEGEGDCVATDVVGAGDVVTLPVAEYDTKVLVGTADDETDDVADPAEDADAVPDAADALGEGDASEDSVAEADTKVVVG